MSDLIRQIQLAQRNAGEALVIAHLKASGLVTEEESEAPKSDREQWCVYVAGMVGAYLNMGVDDPKIKAIAGIIERRLYLLPNTTDEPRPGVGSI